MQILCPSCGHRLQIDAPLATSATIRVRCSRCSARFHVDRLTGAFAHHDPADGVERRTDAIGASMLDTDSKNLGRRDTDARQPLDSVARTGRGRDQPPRVVEPAPCEPTSAVEPSTKRADGSSTPSSTSAAPDESFERGARALRAGRLPEALEHFTRCLQLDPDRPDCQIQLAITRMRLALAAGRVDFDGLEVAFKKALAVAPDLVDGWLGLGTLWKLRGHPNKAKKCFRTVLELDSGNIEATREIRLQRLRDSKPTMPRAKTSSVLRLFRKRG